MTQRRGARLVKNVPYRTDKPVSSVSVLVNGLGVLDRSSEDGSRYRLADSTTDRRCYTESPLQLEHSSHATLSHNTPTPFTVISLLPPGLPLRTFAWTVSSELLATVFDFIFSLFFRLWTVR